MRRIGLRNLPIAVVLLTLLFGVGASLLLARLDAERRASDERGRVVAELAAVRARLEGVIKATFGSTDGLVHLVGIQGGISSPLFDEMARRAIGNSPYIRNIAIAPDDTITMVYPLAGNEAVIGFRHDSKPDEYQDVKHSREIGLPVLAGPLDLVQGGRGLINRAPIFTAVGAPPGQTRYWGTINIVAHVEAILNAGGLADAANLRVALRGKNGSDGLRGNWNLIGGDETVFAQDPISMEMPVPGGMWQLAGLPVGGWWMEALHQSRYFRIGLANTLVLAWVVAMLALRDRQLRRQKETIEIEVEERRRIEAALQEEERRFRVLFELSPDPAWIIENNRFVECNEAAAGILGYSSRAEILDVHPSRLSPETQPDGESSFSKADRMMAQARSERVTRFEWVHRRRDGSDFFAEVTLSSIDLKHREVLYCVWRDISERKQADAALRANQTLLQAIIESAGAVIYVFDREGRLVICNKHFEEVVGCRRDQVIGQTRYGMMPADMAAEHEANDRTVMATKSQIVFEERNAEADGVHYYHTVKGPFLDGGAVRGVVGISTDITDRKRTEEKLSLAATVLASTDEGVVITDAQANIVSVNRAFTEINGYEEHEVKGLNPRIVKSERQDPAFYQAMWSALLKVGTWQGEIWNRRKNGELFPVWLTISAIRNAEDVVVNYVGVFSDITSIKRSQDQLERLAHFDPLTDLPNRVLFQDRLAHAIDRANRYEHGIGVLLLDLDGFKDVNDTLGHPVGDRLLQLVAERLRGCIRVEDTVARLGGDEFAVILVNLVDGGDAIEVVRKILTGVQKPFDLDGNGALVTASVGIAVYPADGASATELVRNADAAMYGAKEGGRNTYRFYQSQMTARAQERLVHERALRRGIECREFEVWFQPQVSLRDGRMTGAEALVRWRDPERGLVPPGEFIPLAERTGLIVPLGELVLDQVCAHARQWLDAGRTFGRLALNVAPPQFERSDFVAALGAALARYRIPYEALEVEITESFLMENAGNAKRALLAIQSLGVTTAVDDFGTGYSSLAYLKELPIDNLKIDRAFVKDLPDDPNDMAIVRAIVAMGHSLGFKVIAEGIETRAQRDFLSSTGCEEAQGYWFARPMPPDEFEAWMSNCAGPDL